MNLVEEAKINEIKKFIMHHETVYGENKNFPLKENEKLIQKISTQLVKSFNEEIAEMHQKIDNINFVGLRFFTIFGEGRLDMFMMKLFRLIWKKIFYLNNFGNHERDFTYIGDVVKTVENTKKFNTCSF